MSSLKWGLVRSKTAPINATQSGTWEDLCTLATTHRVNAHKDGPGWCPADFRPGARNSERAGPWCAMVLDIEGKTENVTPGKPQAGKRVVGPLPPSVDEIAAELSLQGWACCVATSYSHEGPAEAGTLGPRYRLVFAVSRPVLPAEIEALGLHLADLLGLSECLDTGCLESARLFYVPRCPQERQHLAQSAAIEGVPLDVEALLAQKRIADAPPPPRKATATASVIDAFNEAHDIGVILENAGYEPKGRRRWVFPGSSTGVAGVVQLPKSERVYSHHPNDPLYCKTHSHDAFSAWCILKHANNMAAAVRDAARLLGMDRCQPEALTFDDLIAGGDALKSEQTQDTQSVQATRVQPPAKPGFAFVSAGELVRTPTPTAFLIDEMIETQSLALLFGPSMAGKSFVAIGWSACVATGAPWLGRDTAQGAVFYLAGEGHAGVSRRLKAWELHNAQSLADAPLFVSKTPAALMDAASAVSVTLAIEDLCLAHGKPALIVIDTFARNMGDGDENSNADVGLFVNHLDLMKARLGCCVMLVHHTGHMEAQRARGGSALPAAMDSIFRTDPKPGGPQLVHVKSKESELSQPLTLSIESVPLPGWLDAKGREMSSAVIVPCHAGAAPFAEKPLTERQGEAWEAYLDAAELHGQLDDDGEFIGLHRDLWRGEFYVACAADSHAAKQKAFVRAMKDLVNVGRLTVKDDVFMLAGLNHFLNIGRIKEAIKARKNIPDTDIARTLPGHCL